MSSSNDDWYTPVSDIGPLVEKLRQVAVSRKTHSAQWRKSQLHALSQLITQNRQNLGSALEADMGQKQQYAEMFELQVGINLIQFALDHLDEWMSNERVPTPFPSNLSQPVHSEMTSYPRGVVLIITPWNFPIALVLNCLINAISAGNCCVIKPSEISTNSSRLLTRLIKEYLDPEAVAVVAGDVAQSTELLRHRWDAIAYTGGLRVAQIVAAAAAKHLTPMLLELGGKTPVFVCEDAHLESAAMRIAWGKWAGNCGQFCIAPDYVLVVEPLREKLITEIKRLLIEWYGEDPEQSTDFGRLISVQHATRVAQLVDSSCKILHGGTRHKLDKRFLEPTIVEATIKSTIMQEEIFGPILAVVSVPSTEAAIQFVNDNFNSKGHHPLAMYVFSKSKQKQRLVMDSVLSGMCCVNHVVLMGGNFHLPFGGVGYSGIGAYYGKHGFDFFSHRRGALVSNNYSASLLDPANWVMLPPYTDKKLSFYRLISQVPLYLTLVGKAIKVVAPVILSGLFYYYPAAVREFNLNVIIEYFGSLFS